MEGKIKFYNENKGFGFITMDNEEDLFFHVSEIQNQEELTEGDDVRFDIGNGERGKKAVKVMKL